MRKIEVDWNRVKGKLDRFYNFCVGAGRANELLRRDALEQLKQVHQACGFRYLRFHGLLCDDMAVYREDKKGNPIYNWQYIDMVYDAILEVGMRPFVELSFMPEALASGTKTVFWWKANVTPPKSLEKWYDLIHRLVLHLEARYGRDEVKNWYFEVWNEPNHPHFFSRGIDEYFEMYDTAAKAIKDVCQEYRVGGPATAGNAWIPELISHCLQCQVPLDFVTTHTYGVTGDFDEFGVQQLYLNEDKNCIIQDVQRVYRQIKESELPDLELHYTEWNSSYSSRDPVHDSYIQAPYILYNLKRLSGSVNSMSYWTFTDIFEEAGPGPKPFHGGFGLINMQGFCKPAFYAYRFLNELSDIELVNADSDSFVCRSENAIQALLWNYTKPKQDAPNQDYFTRDLPSTYAESVTLNFTGIPMGEYELEVFQVGYGVNDIYTEYLHRNFRDLPTREETAELKDIISGEAIVCKKVDIDWTGEFTYQLDLRENDVYFIRMKQI